MTITGQSSLNRDDIDQMVRDAESHAEEDRRRKEEADARNTGDTLLYQTEKLLRDSGDKMSEGDRATIEASLAELKQALAGSDPDAINTATEALMEASQKVSQSLYEQAAAEQPGDADGAPGGAGDEAGEDVVDAEVIDDAEVVDDAEGEAK